MQVPLDPTCIIVSDIVLLSRACTKLSPLSICAHVPPAHVFAEGRTKGELLERVESVMDIGK